MGPAKVLALLQYTCVTATVATRSSRRDEFAKFLGLTRRCGLPVEVKRTNLLAGQM
jgi:hypothetical protein